MKIKYLAQAGIIAALYVVFTLIANAAGLASGVIQVRISEALTVLPFFTPAAIPGLFLVTLLAAVLYGILYSEALQPYLVLWVHMLSGKSFPTGVQLSRPYLQIL